MVLLQPDPFLNELTSMFERSTEKGSIWVTLKRSSMKCKANRKKMETTGEPIEYRCLVRATDGKKTISASTVVLKVGMSCQGCVGAVNRVLTKMEGVESFDVNLKEQKVTVKGNVKPEAVLQTVSKTGKKTSFWEVEPFVKETAPVPEAATTAA